MSHTYQEIRAAALHALGTCEQAQGQPHEYLELRRRVSALLSGCDDLLQAGQTAAEDCLDEKDKDTLLTLFWELVREGVLRPGLNAKHPNFPFFTVTGAGANPAADSAGESGRR